MDGALLVSIQVAHDTKPHRLDIAEYRMETQYLRKPVKTYLQAFFNYKTEVVRIWPTCSWRENGYCNGGKFTREDLVVILESVCIICYSKDLECVMRISNDCWKIWKSHEIYYHDYDEEEYENKTHKEGHELCEEYVAIKEDEYDDLTITSEEACRAYREIFQMMDAGWMVTGTRPRERNIDEYWWRIYKSGDLEVLES
ncbi:hypothetical protein Tco_1135257 [Tanacetum coccineum]